MLDSETWSMSINVMLRTPLLASASAAQDPTPPIPMTATLACCIRRAASAPNKRDMPLKRLSISAGRSES